ncbi:NAD(P)-binding domain protein [Cordyceps fumosorosea ARSEF 2679]|uniref:NAD(P)-binding domain protein n=1 Tax=Cordyceps fumosorosea (strain ARSEF 2679) TaxID=1081104 RepID=A0A168AMT9_CORFA|nr:NAD(P)-binding domain protein [Cordyceps fumosorosea ARSEF 2679]OAA68956.1 NAD(P)-binding domain protein [Cordyceps fumosorosea ARSEF 2679]
MANSKTVVITGATRGIGYETARAFLESPNSYHVFLGARSLSSGNNAVAQLRQDFPSSASTVEVLLIDVESDQSIENAVETVKTSRGTVDILINNAGAAFDWDAADGKTSLRASFTRAYDINVSGAHVTTFHFIPLLLASPSRDPRILFLAGLSHLTLAAAEDMFPSGPVAAGWPKTVAFETVGYRCSKTALSMLMLDWRWKLREDGVRVFSVSPGFCVTGLGNKGEAAMEEMGAARTARQGARTVLAVAEGRRDADIGRIIDEDGVVPW